MSSSFKWSTASWRIGWWRVALIQDRKYNLELTWAGFFFVRISEPSCRGNKAGFSGLKHTRFYNFSTGGRVLGSLFEASSMFITAFCYSLRPTFYKLNTIIYLKDSDLYLSSLAYF
jgi:hypothetical protein